MSTLVLKFNATNVISKMAPMLPNFIVPSWSPRGLVQEMPCTKSWGDLMASCHRHWACEHKMHAFDAPCGVLCNWSTRANQGQIKDKNLMIFLKENCNDYRHKSHGTNEEVTKGGPMWYWGTNGCGFTQLCTHGIFVLSKVLLNYAPGLCIWLSMVLTDNMLWPILFCYSAMLF